MLGETILVTGGAGFIGCNFVRHWLKSGPGTVVNLDKLSFAGNMGKLSDFDGDKRHVFVKRDVSDQAVVDTLLTRYQPRAILQRAAASILETFVQVNHARSERNILRGQHLLDHVNAGKACACYRGLGARCRCRSPAIKTNYWKVGRHNAVSWQ